MLDSVACLHIHLATKDGILAMNRRAQFASLYAAVIDALADGRYRPGDRIPLKALADHLHVSTTPLREALSRLVGRDVVSEQRNEGYYLSRLDARDIADLYRLHLACINLAIAVLPNEPGVIVAGGDTIWDMFDAIVVASGDRILTDVRRYLDDRLRLVRRAEASLAFDGALIPSFHAALASADRRTLRGLCDQFHTARIDQAPQISERLGRSQSFQNIERI